MPMDHVSASLFHKQVLLSMELSQKLFNLSYTNYEHTVKDMVQLRTIWNYIFPDCPLMQHRSIVVNFTLFCRIVIPWYLKGLLNSMT